MYQYESGRDVFSRNGARAALACVIAGVFVWACIAAVVL